MENHEPPWRTMYTNDNIWTTALAVWILSPIYTEISTNYYAWLYIHTWSAKPLHHSMNIFSYVRVFNKSNLCMNIYYLFLFKDIYRMNIYLLYKRIQQIKYLCMNIHFLFLLKDILHNTNLHIWSPDWLLKWINISLICFYTPYSRKREWLVLQMDRQNMLSSLN